MTWKGLNLRVSDLVFSGANSSTCDALSPSGLPALGNSDAPGGARGITASPSAPHIPMARWLGKLGLPYLLSQG